MILCCDDDPMIRELLGAILAEAKMPCMMAANGDDALALARERRPDLIVLDVKMPGASGFEVLEQLQRDPELSGTPVLFLSSASEPDDVLRGYELGAVDYLTKPFDPRMLLPKLRSLAVRQRRMRRFGAADFAVGATVRGRYQLESELGSGAASVVFAARDLRDGSTVALKALRTTFAVESDSADQRFLREVEALQRLDHPHLVQLLDAQVGDGVSFYTMPLCAGGSLAERLARSGPMPVREALAVCAAIAEGLSAAHAAGILHRDVKPQNILFDAVGTPLLGDFGLALEPDADPHRLTRTGLMVGTPQYMSPEQISQPHEVDARTDVYALGVVLFEMLTGRRPFEAQSDFSAMLQRLSQPPPPPSLYRRELPDALDALCLDALARDPGDRLQSAAAFAARIAALGR